MLLMSELVVLLNFCYLALLVVVHDHILQYALLYLVHKKLKMLQGVLCWMLSKGYMYRFRTNVLLSKYVAFQCRVLDDGLNVST